MKKNEIKTGGIYSAKISNIICDVRVDKIRVHSNPYGGKDATRYDVTNLRTGRKTTFNSAAKFRGEVKAKAQGTPTSPTKPSGASKPTQTPPKAPEASGGQEEYTSCDRCDGTGTCDEDGERFACPDCDGTGEVESKTEEAKVEPPFPGTPVTDLIRAWNQPTKATSREVPPAESSTQEESASVSSAELGDSSAIDLEAPLCPVVKTAPHIIVSAVAGSGKTTSLIEGMKFLLGIPTKIQPSEQQQAIWDCIALSSSNVKAGMVAFNKSIADELRERVPAGVEAMTMHSLGNKALSRRFGFRKVGNWATMDYIAEIMGREIRDLMKDPKEFAVVKAAESLVALCKQNLTDPNDKEALDKLVSHYEVEMNCSQQKVYDLVPIVLEKAKSGNKICFDDMIWLPVVLDLPVQQYDLLFIDEAQDLNRAQQALAKKAGTRLVFVGDERQAIYGFAGADAESLPRLYEELSATPEGCVKLPLNVTRRCGKRIVQEAQAIVPEFFAHESNSEGEVKEARYPRKPKGTSPGIAWDKSYSVDVQDGDMILCRVNAPLVSHCFRFLKQGRKAVIQGRDVGTGLINTVKKVAGSNRRQVDGKWVEEANNIPTVDFVAKLDAWAQAEIAKEQAKKYASDSKIIALQDRVDCLLCFTEGVQDTQALIAKILSVFTDDRSVKGIRLSSIHKAKGLEAHNVFFLCCDEAPCPHPMSRSAWQQEQEMNLKYVGITRAIKKLVWVN